MVQWLRLHASYAGSVDLIHGQGTKIPHALWHGGKKFIFHLTQFKSHMI